MYNRTPNQHRCLEKPNMNESMAVFQLAIAMWLFTKGYPVLYGTDWDTPCPTVDGRNPAPVDVYHIIYKVYTSQVVQNFRTINSSNRGKWRGMGIPYQNECFRRNLDNHLLGYHSIGAGASGWTNGKIRKNMEKNTRSSKMKLIMPCTEFWVDSNFGNDWNNGSLPYRTKTNKT